MTLLDRYLLRNYMRVLLVSLLSLTGLFIIVDLFGNLEEFMSYAQKQNGLTSVLIQYYGPRVFSFYDRTSGLLALTAAIFTITLLHRRNELTAVMAAGVPKRRVVRPLILATIAVSLLAAANREWVLPRVRDRLSRNAQDWLGESAKHLDPRYDYQTRVLIGGRSTIAARQEIEQPSFRLPGVLSQFGRQIVATKANYQPPTGKRPGGYLVTGVKQPEDIAGIPSAYLGRQPVILTPHDVTWLNKGQCFVVSDVTFEYLAAGRSWQQYGSMVELIGALRNPSLGFGADTRVVVHSRLVRPLLDVTLLLLGLPLVLARSNRNMFVAGAKCLVLVAGFYVVILVFQALGNNNYLVSPSLAAWCPLLLLGPVAYAAAQRHWE